MNISRQKLIEELEEVIKWMEEYCADDDYHNGLVSGLKRAINHATAEPPADQWIPCSSGRMPDEIVPVNITWVNRKPPIYYKEFKDIPFSGTGIFYGGKWYWYSVRCEDVLAEYGENEADEVDEEIEVTAWKPLGDPYKGE